MKLNISKNYDILLTDYCIEKQISYEEAINNILAEFFTERQRKGKKYEM